MLLLSCLVLSVPALATCRYIADLVVGAFALHQRSGPAFALSAAGELSGWHPAPAAGPSSRQGDHPALSSSRGSQSSGHLQIPSSGAQRVAREAMSSQGSIGGRGLAARTASVAPPRTSTPPGRAPGAVGPPPRLLLLRPDGSGREVLDAAAFEAYRRQQVGLPARRWSTPGFKACQGTSPNGGGMGCLVTPHGGIAFIGRPCCSLQQHMGQAVCGQPFAQLTPSPSSVPRESGAHNRATLLCRPGTRTATSARRSWRVQRSLAPRCTPS